MRHGLTLVELIFSMVIIAIVFTIVPKIIFASNKSLQLSMKEDALFNAYSLMGSIIRLPWDENSLVDGKILGTDANGACNNTRVGGFIGSRNCIDSDLNASTIGSESGDSDDIDDYHASTIDVNKTVSGVNKNIYDIDVSVEYVNGNYAGSANTQELKEVKTTVYSGADNQKMSGFKASFFYHSANLGQTQIKKRAWIQ
ncbi:MAG: prepilin-type N-terminal cleavage/methylation domain-containing protein [Campylobacterota bacterium]|nr:prepilin-type N-terminal cleavage/methylation domain-containing protein [Campylobacterota bacterium]